MNATCTVYQSFSQYAACVYTALDATGTPRTAANTVDMRHLYEDKVSPQAAASYFRDSYLDLALSDKFSA